MAVNVVMPKAGLTMTHGTIGEWLKSEGSQVEKGELILNIENEKTTIEVVSPHDGILHITSEPGEEYPISETIALLAESQEEYARLLAESKSASAPAAEKMADDAAPAAVAPAAPVRAAAATEVGRVKASPNARRVAKGLGIDLSLVIGTGPDGRIVERDVHAFAKNPPAAPSAVSSVQPTRVPMSSMRRTIAKRMVESLQAKAQVTASVEIDVTELVALHDKLRASAEAIGIKITYTDLFARIMVPVLKKHPYANAGLEGDDILLYPNLNLSIAVSVDNGLQVPVVRDVQSMSLVEVSRAIKTISQKARDGKLTAEDMEGGTFTITNVGMFPIDFGTPIINGNQSAILGMGRIVKKPAVLSGEIAVRSMMTVFLTFDHQVFDGAEACGILQDVKDMAEHPERFLAV